MDKIDELRDKRDSLNLKVREKAQEHKKQSDAFKKARNEFSRKKAVCGSVLSSLNSFKKHRKKLKELLKKKKKELNEAEKGLRGVKEGMPTGKMQREIKRLEDILYTEVMPVKKEDELASKISSLEAQMKKSGKAREILKSYRQIDVEIGKAEQELDILDELSLDLYHRLDVLRPEIREILAEMKKYREPLRQLSQEIVSFKKDADKAHQEFSTEILRMQLSNKGQRHRKDLQTKTDMGKKADEVMQQFKKGKKLTAEDLILLKEYGKS